MLSHAAGSGLAAFMASLVEFVEALTIVLAVGTMRGWRPALLGSAAGTLLLLALVLVFGPLLGRIPLPVLQTAIGFLLLLFGMRWLRKAILRSAGVIPLHDESLIYTREVEALGEAPRGPAMWDTVGVITSFKAVVLEGLEVVFIVLAVGAAGKSTFPASLGAAAAFLIVLLLGLVVHRPLARVPENTLKFAVGVILCAFGTFWVGEGSGLVWPGEDLAILGLALGFLTAATLGVALVRRLVAARTPAPALARTSGQ